MGMERALVAALSAVLLASCSTSQAKRATQAPPATQAAAQAAPTTQAERPIQAQQAPVSFTDPDDVNLPLDLKTLTHTSDASTITYTVETYEPFKDDQADFSWGIDKNNDGVVDDYVSVEFESKKLEGKFEDPKENDLGKA